MTDQDVGSVGEEAAKLLGALGDWAKTQSGGHADNVAGLADGLGERLQDINEHLATDAVDNNVDNVVQAFADDVYGADPEQDMADEAPVAVKEVKADNELLAKSAAVGVKFADFDLPKAIRESLARMEYVTPTKIQAMAIPFGERFQLRRQRRIKSTPDIHHEKLAAEERSQHRADVAYELPR